MAIIYKVTNKINNRAYIGYTTQTLDARKGQHISDMKRMDRCKIFQNALRKYGSNNFEWEVILENATLEDEIRLIEEHGTHKNRYGYNVTLGGEGNFGNKHSIETKQKMSQTRKGRKLSEEHKQNLRKPKKNVENYKKPKSEATKQKMRQPKSESHKEAIRRGKLGKPRSPEMQEKLRNMRKGVSPWNKGLSAETNEKVRLNIERRLATVRKNKNNGTTS